MHKYLNLLLAVLGGVLLWAAWPVSPLTFLIFFAFLPLLWIEDHTATGKKFFGLAYLNLLLWNLLTTWWIYNASAVGALMAIVLNSLIMCGPWLLMRWTKRRMGRGFGYASLIVFWISFEYLHHNWELSWPWLTLGNAFAMKPGWIQWYEATGTTGGTLWVLLSNVLLYRVFLAYRHYGRTRRVGLSFAGWILLLVVPLLISRSLLGHRQEGMDNGASALKNVVVVQPNVDPYEEKFTAGTQEAQIQRMIALAELQIDGATALVVWPETAIPVGVWEDEIRWNPYYGAVWNFLQRHPQLSLLSGIESYRKYGSDKGSATPTARHNAEAGFYYDAFNTAAMLQPDSTAAFYHKAKLVPGVETLPSFLLFIGSLFEDFGGTSGTLGRDKQRTVFADRQHYYVAAPIICYESIYGDYVTEYVRKGANLLTIITNDGWWDNTPGYRQHLNYARLRAIETRRWIARSANTGVSCFLDPLGNIYQPRPWDTPAVIKMNIEPLQAQTFFVRHGDFLSRISNGVAAVFGVLLLVTTIRNRPRNKKSTHEKLPVQRP